MTQEKRKTRRRSAKKEPRFQVWKDGICYELDCLDHHAFTEIENPHQEQSYQVTITIKPLKKKK